LDSIPTISRRLMHCGTTAKMEIMRNIKEYRQLYNLVPGSNVSVAWNISRRNIMQLSAKMRENIACDTEECIVFCLAGTRRLLDSSTGVVAGGGRIPISKFAPAESDCACLIVAAAFGEVSRDKFARSGYKLLERYF
jgi:hypothetical protein